jgi:membrane fusion protein (multidrug efflux system)
MNTNTLYKLMQSSLMILTLACVASCGSEQSSSQAQPKGEMATKVTLTPVTEEIVIGYKQYPANVVPLKETELRAEVSGYITGIFVNDGAVVKAGQKLYEIDQVRYAAALEQAQANLQIAEANRERVQRDLVRYETLASKEAIAKQILDNSRTELQTAEAQLMSAKAAYTTAKTNVERSSIRAPFDGIIGISQVRNGALVSAGGTLLNTISTVNPIAVEFQVSENELSQIIGYQNQPQVLKDSIITLVLNGSETYTHPGQLTVVDRAINRNTGTITVRASFENPKGLLRAGLSAIIKIKQHADTKQLVIPYKAISEQLGQTSVYVLADSNRVEQRVIELGMKAGEKAVVISGLSLGDQVVSEGMINLRHGALIRTEN